MYTCLWEGMAVMSLVPIDPSCATLSRGVSQSALAALLPSCPQSAHLQVPNNILVVRLDIQIYKLLSCPVCVYSTFTLLSSFIANTAVLFLPSYPKINDFRKIIILIFLFINPKLVTSTAINLPVTLLGCELRLLILKLCLSLLESRPTWSQ